MAENVIRPRWARGGLDREQAGELRRRIASMRDLPDELRALFLLLVEQRTPGSNARRFAIVDTLTNEAVVRWALDCAKRPRVSIRLWMAFQNHLLTSTNEIVMTRAEMMQVAGASSPHVSVALAEFVSIRALTRHQQGRDVRWRVTMRAATHLGGSARENAQNAAPPLLVAMRGEEQRDA